MHDVLNIRLHGESTRHLGEIGQFDCRFERLDRRADVPPRIEIPSSVASDRDGYAELVGGSRAHWTGDDGPGADVGPKAIHPRVGQSSFGEAGEAPPPIRFRSQQCGVADDIGRRCHDPVVVCHSHRHGSNPSNVAV